MSDPLSEQPDTAADQVWTAAAGVLELKRRITSISKEGFNPQGKFNFRGIDQCINAAGPIERDLGLLILPRLVEETTQQHEYGNNRTLGFRTRVRVVYTWLAADGSTLEVGPIPGEAMDSGDKGTAKAMSVALRIMYLQLLTVPTGEPDPDESSYAVAKPEASVSDPNVEAKLRQQVANADTREKGKKAWAAIVDAHGGEKAMITTELRNELQETLTAAMQALQQGASQQRPPADHGRDASPEDDVSPGVIGSDGGR